MKNTLRERFEAKLVPGKDGCLEFTGYCKRGGYGTMWANGKNQLVHRVAWMLANGEIPEGLHVLHRCDNPRCSRVEHLFLGTQADNMADMAQKGRHGRSGNGGRSRRVVDETMVIFMKELQMQDLNQTQIGECLGVDQTTVSLYLSGKRVAV